MNGELDLVNNDVLDLQVMQVRSLTTADQEDVANQMYDAITQEFMNRDIFLSLYEPEDFGS